MGALGLAGIGEAGSAAAMDENGDGHAPHLAEQEGEGPPVLLALPVRPQCLWTLEPEHAANIRGGQVRCTHSVTPLHPYCEHLWAGAAWCLTYWQVPQFAHVMVLGSHCLFACHVQVHLFSCIWRSFSGQHASACPCGRGWHCGCS